MKTVPSALQNSEAKKPASAAIKAKAGAAKDLRHLFVDELKDIYWAEKALTKALPKMIKNSTSPYLVTALTGHLEETKVHVTRLEDVFTSIGQKAVAKKCEAMEGITKEAEEIMEETVLGLVRDAGIVSAGQKVEHYEMATYTTLISFAQALGEDKAASLLKQTLDEERKASDKLTTIVETLELHLTGAEAMNEKTR